MITFSKLVDNIITKTGRSGRIDDIKKYINGTIRECQMQAYFARDLLEDALTPDVAPYIWTPPTTFRVMRAVNYTGIKIGVRNMPPGRIQEGEDYYYYRSGGDFVFNGAEIDGSIAIAYYNYLDKLLYYDENLTANFTAPALYDEYTMTWTYLQAGAYVSTLGTTALDTAAKALVTNWLLDKFEQAIEEGCLAKFYKGVDDNRSNGIFTVFSSLKKDITKGETFESLDL